MGNFDQYFPFDRGFGTPASSASWRKMAQLWECDGVFQGYPVGLAATVSQLYATISAGTVTVQPGAVFTHGYYAEIVTAQAITGVGANGTVVARVDLVNEVCSIVYRDTVIDYGTNPATSYEQSANNWEIPLWLVQSGVLVDLRTMIGPGRVTGWWNNAAGPFTVGVSATVQQNFLVARVPYGLTTATVPAIGRGGVMIAFTTGTATAQTAQCQLTYQYGQSDAQLGPVVTPSWPASTGPAAGTIVVPIHLSAKWNLTQGRKQFGLLVTAGAGPALTLTNLSASVELLNTPAMA